MKVLVVADSPTITTGFACVARNMVKQWLAKGVEVEVWGINYNGWPHEMGCRIYPGGSGVDWHGPQRIQGLLRQLGRGGYTHLWMMQDTFQFCQTDFPARLKKLAAEKKIRTLLYFPVDSPLEPAWTDIIDVVDTAVAYTEYGKREAELKGLARGYKFKCRVLPHGVDQEIFRPIPNREEIRSVLYEDKWVGAGDFLILNVNANQRRKDMPRSLEVVAGLKAAGVPAKLLLNCARVGSDDMDLAALAYGWGLKDGDFATHDQYFKGGISMLAEEDLPKVYSMADLLLTTSTGEGWGLPVTEALACGCPVAMPFHTSLGEIAGEVNRFGMGDRLVELPALERVTWPFDNSRIRPRVSVQLAVERIRDYYLGNKWKERPKLNQQISDWLSWERVAAVFMAWMRE